MKEKIKTGIKHLIFSNFLVSISIGFLCLGICIQLNIPNSSWYGLFVFSSTLLTYNVQRFIKSTQTVPHPTNHIIWVLSHEKELYLICTLSLLSCVYSFYQIFHWSFISLFILIISSFISLFYVYKIRSKNLRDAPYLKIHLIALVWVIALGVFELVNEKIYDLEKWMFVLIHYLYIVAITIPFDIRDLKYDDPKQRTIPQVFGVIQSKILSICLLIIYATLALYFNSRLEFNLIFMVCIFITLLLIMGVKESRNEFYFSGFIEGSILLVGVSLIY